MRKALSLVLAALLIVSLLAGCGTSGSSATSENPAESTASTSTPATGSEQSPETAEPADTQEPSTESDTLYVYEMPLTDEPAELSFWYVFPTPFLTFMSGPEDFQAYTEMENRSNVHLNWVINSPESSVTNFNIMVTSGEYPDLLYNASDKYTQGLDAAVDNDVVLPLEDVVEEYMPCYSYWRKTDATFAKNTATDQHIAAIWGYCPNEIIETGPYVRQDILDALNIETPHTYDDYYELLKAFKTEYNGSAPLSGITSNGLLMGGNYLTAGYGIAACVGMSSSTLPFYVIDDEVLFGPTQPAFKEWLQLMNKWFSEGLIDPNFTSNTDSDWTTSLVANTDTVFWYAQLANLPAYTEEMTGVEGINVVAAYDPVRNEGDVNHFRPYQTGTSYNSISISTNCENVELACHWLDYWFSEEGSLLGTWGVEGEGYDVVDGKKTISENVLNNPDGIPMGIANTKYTLNRDIYYRDGERDSQLYTSAQLDAMKIWSTADIEWTYPANASRTLEESQEYGLLISDVKTYLEESIPAFITGAKPIDEFDDFVATLESDSMNLNRLIEIMQASYDRYTQR